MAPRRLRLLGSVGPAGRTLAAVAASCLIAGLAYLIATGNPTANNAASAGTAKTAPTPVRPALTVQVGPASQSVTRGQTASFAVTVTSVGGFTGTVALTAAGVPAGSTAGFNPVVLSIPVAGHSASSTFTIGTGSATKLGSSTVTVTATSGKISGSVSAGLTVNPAPNSSLAITATPGAVTMAPGGAAVFTVTLNRQNLPGSVGLAVVGSLPSGSSVSATPNPTTGNTITVQVSTPDTANDGSYPLHLVASGRATSGLLITGNADVQLTLVTSGKPFSISGNLTGLLAPGVSLPLDLTLTNPNKKPISISNLTVTIASVTRTPAAIAANKPCGLADYLISQYSGGYPLRVGGQSSVKLSWLYVSPAQLPHVQMVNTASNQDGCKGASISLAYAGSGQGS